MPFQAYLPVGFAHSHESRMFEQLTKVLAAGFGPGREPVYLIGNAMFDDKELDAVLFKSDALFAVDDLETAVKRAISVQKAGPVLLREMLLSLLRERVAAPPTPAAATAVPAP